MKKYNSIKDPIKHSKTPKGKDRIANSAKVTVSSLDKALEKEFGKERRFI